MAVKYKSSWKDNHNIDWEIKFDDLNYVGSETEIVANVVMGMQPIDEIDEAIRSRYLNIEVIADSVTDFTDLLDAEERSIGVTFYKDGNKEFFGYLTTEGALTSMNNEQYVLSMQALCPTAFLEDLAYVNNATGALKTGQSSLIFIIASCLIRGFRDSADEFDIVAMASFHAISIDKTTRNFITHINGDFIEDMQVYQEMFIDADTQEPKSCREVLKSILSDFSLCVMQADGNKWVIYNYYNNAEIPNTPRGTLFWMEFLHYYGSLGSPIPVGSLKTPYSNTDGVVEVKTDVGDGYTPILVEDNSYTRSRGLQKLLTTCKYIRRDADILSNVDLDNTPPTTMSGWTVDATHCTLNTTYVTIDNKQRTVPNDYYKDFKALISTDNVIVEPYTNMVLKLTAQAAAGFNKALFRFNIEAKKIGGISATYYLRYNYPPSGEVQLYWSIHLPTDTNIDKIEIPIGDQDNVDVELQLPPLSVRSNMKVVVVRCADEGDAYASGTQHISLFKLDLQQAEDNVEGKSTECINVESNSLKTDKIQTSILLTEGNTLYNSLTSNIGNQVVSIKPFIMGFSYGLGGSGIVTDKCWTKLVMDYKRKEYMGQIYGFVHPYNIIKLDIISDKEFIITDYLYDTKTGICSLGCYEKNIDDNETDVDVDEFLIYKDEIEPTIK